MYKRFFALLVAVVLVAGLFAGCGQSNTVVIGAIQPISGPVSVYGIQSRDAINMAVEEINAKGGVLGKTLEVFIEDDEADPVKSVSAFKKLVSQKKIIGFVGALTSNCSIPVSKEAQKRKVIMISPSSTNDTVTDAGDYIFRACYKDSFQGGVIAQFSYDTLKAKKAAYIYDNTNDYSIGLKDNFKKKFESLGGTSVAEESYAKGDKDFNAQLTKIKSASPDILLVADYYNTVDLLSKQARDQGITCPMIGADGWEGITDMKNDAVINSYYSNHYAPDANDPEVKDFVAKYKAKYKIVPNALAALAYDATYILAEAIERAGSTDHAKVRDAMMQTDKKFVTGNIKFDEKRNPVKSVTLVKIVKGSDGKLMTEYAGVVNP